jgi:hypothetical protein
MIGSPLEGFEDKNIAASVCRSTPNGLNDLNSKIEQCTTTTEQTRNTNFAENTFRLQKDIESLTGTVGDSLTMGDSMFGQFGYQDIAKQVKDRNHELKSKKDLLLKEVEKGESIIERSSRDFSDVRNTLPESQPKRALHFIEDYTLAILTISYLFMIIAIIYVYTASAEIKLVAFGKASIGSVLITIFLFVLLYFLT